MKKQIFYVIGIILLVLSFFIDKTFSLFVFNLRNSFFNNVFIFLSSLNNSFIVFILMTLLLYLIKKRKEIFLMWFAFFTSGFFSLILKLITNRVRPFTELSLNLLNNINYHFAVWNTAFPSWHTAALFVVYPFLNKKVKYYWIVFALLLSFSRIYTGVHYLSDVIGGILLGHSIAWLIIFLNRRFKIIKI